MEMISGRSLQEGGDGGTSPFLLYMLEYSNMICSHNLIRYNKYSPNRRGHRPSFLPCMPGDFSSQPEDAFPMQLLTSCIYRLESLASLRGKRWHASTQLPLIMKGKMLLAVNIIACPILASSGAWITSPDIFLYLVLSRHESRESSDIAALLIPQTFHRAGWNLFGFL